MVVADGDMVKIDLGVHIDGYISVVAHTLIVGAVANPEVRYSAHAEASVVTVL